MIITLTANPSVDRTISLTEPLERGAVHRADAAVSEPGGKGINVARVLSAAGARATALIPVSADDPLLWSLTEYRIDHLSVPVTERARTNLTITEPDGTTTKINEAGNPLPDSVRAELTHRIRELAASASWVALCGSLPPGAPDDWYADLVEILRDLPVRIAVDTSDAPLRALADRFPSAAPHVIKPNAEELAQLTGVDPDILETAAAHGDPSVAIRAAEILVDRGVQAVLATLGASGAVLVTAAGAWYATAPAIVARSTVGAGDSALAGYLLAQSSGADPATCLQHAVAYGSAAAALPGTALPQPHHIDLAAVTVTAATPATEALG